MCCPTKLTRNMACQLVKQVLPLFIFIFSSWTSISSKPFKGLPGIFFHCHQTLKRRKEKGGLFLFSFFSVFYPIFFIKMYKKGHWRIGSLQDNFILLPKIIIIIITIYYYSYYPIFISTIIKYLSCYRYLMDLEYRLRRLLAWFSR